MNAIRRGLSKLDKGLTMALGCAILVSSGLAYAVDKIGAAASAARAAPSASANTTILANQILDRWQPIAQAAGVNAASWREIYATQLSNMPGWVLERIEAVPTDAADTANANYAQFTNAVRNALMQSYLLAKSGKGTMKLGS